MKYLLCWLVISTAQAISLPWPFQNHRSAIQMKLQHGGHTLNLIYRFSDAEDRVWIKSKNPHWNGIELFRGKLRSIAVREESFEKIRKRMDHEVQSRIELFPSTLGTLESPTQTQALFADENETYLLDLDENGELVFLAFHKIYTRPVNVELAKTPASEKSRSFLATVHEDTGMDQASVFYEPFAHHLRKENQRAVFQAIQSLVENQNSFGLTAEDRQNLATLDHYVLPRGMVDPQTQIISLPSRARRVGEALEMRLLAFGAEPSETWLFSYESWQKTFIYTNHGLIIGRLHGLHPHLVEKPEKNEVLLKMSYPPRGFSAGDEFALVVPMEGFHRRVLEQRRKGLQGHSDAYKALLEDVCSKFLNTSPR